MNATLDLFSGISVEAGLPDGLSYHPGYITREQQTALSGAIDAMPWSCELKRRVQHYGYRYDYKARKIDASMYLGDLPPFVADLARSLETEPVYGQRSDQLIINEYLPGQGISAHVDCESCFNDRVAVISLGWAYEMDFVELKSKRCFSLLLEPGSLLALSGESRYLWTHQIRSRLRDNDVPRQRRVSLTFRKVLFDGL